MALTGHIIQANLNCSAPAQDLLLQVMAERRLRVAVVAEPYRFPPRESVVDLTGKLAIFRAKAANVPAINVIARGQGFAVVKWGRMYIVGLYASPNAHVSSLQGMLDDIRYWIAPLMTHEVLVIGDFNAKSTLWGSPRTDPRGEAVADWAAELHLQLLNDGRENTCVRWQGESKIDLAWASPSAACKVKRWKVDTEAETLSDHRYILISLTDGGCTGDVLPRTRGRDPDRPRWAIKRVDKDRLITAAHAAAWTASAQETTLLCAEARAEQFQTHMTRVCDASMPRVKSAGRRATYWWTPELEGKRRQCVLTRRKYQHRKRKATVTSEELEQTRLAYRKAVVALQTAIRAAKRRAWEELIEDIDRDPWGRPYKIVTDKLRPSAPPLTESMEPELLQRTVSTLFPRDREETSARAFPSPDSDQPPLVTMEELGAVVKRMEARNTAPGPDGIPGKAIALALTVWHEELVEILNSCLREGKMPACWKKARLVLIPKPGKEKDSPAAYRPLCLLNDTGKILERILMVRITEHLTTSGPNLHDHQYGFRQGRSTIDAIDRVVGLAESAIQRGRVALAVSIDIVNAFNTLPWRAIRKGLTRHKLPDYLVRIVSDYLTGRSVEYRERKGYTRQVINRGVPQGSVLGPLLWNLGYDQVLGTVFPAGVHITCYADDTLLIACSRSWANAVRKMDIALEALVQSITEVGLEIAAQKTEAVWLHGLPLNRRPPRMWVTVRGERVQVGGRLKYLGVVLDSRLKYEAHFAQVTPRVGRLVNSVSRLLPNVKGPREKTRRLYASVAQSMVLYGAPVWAKKANITPKNTRTLRATQRRMAIRTVRAYRTISVEAALTLAGMTPYDHLARAYSEAYWKSRRGEMPGRDPDKSPAEELKLALKKASDSWKQELETTQRAGRRVVEAILPSWEQWAVTGPALLTYRATQILTGHGCFGEYLRKIGAEETAACHHCSADVDSAQHTLEACGAFSDQRCRLVGRIGSDLTPAALIRALLAGEEERQAVLNFCEEVMSIKEAAERERERIIPERKRKRRRSRRPHTISTNRDGGGSQGAGVPE